MSLDGQHGLQVVVALRRLDERQRRLALAKCIAGTEKAKALLGTPPEPEAPADGLTEASFLAKRARLHMEWAVYGARLERSQRAAAAEAAAQAAWRAAAADLRSAERLLGRRVHRARTEAARRAQKDLDEVAVVGWRRRDGKKRQRP